MNTLRHSVAAKDLRLDRYDSVLDARSPAEYAEDHLPGALSFPVLDDAERARVGCLYKQASPFDARKLGAALVARNIARHVETSLMRHGRDWRPLVYCWRGGKRSGAFVHILREIGWDAHVLEGGYRAYRRQVVEKLAALPGQLQFRIVQGATGSGKSRLLAALRGAGAQVLDLEQLAAHRGSVLGNLPDQPQPTQKRFETLLLAAIEAFDPTRAVYIEGESRKIGQVQLPEALILAMRAAECLVLETALHARVALLLDEYRHFFHDPAALEARLEHLVPLHGRDMIDGWKKLVRSASWEELVNRLLVQHYDPAYRRSAPRNFVRLPEARTVRIASEQPGAFAAVAQRLAAEEHAAGEPASVMA